MPNTWEVQAFGMSYAEPSRNGIYKSAEFQGRGTRIVNMGEMFGYEFISDQEMSRIALTSKEMSITNLRDGDLLFGRRSVVPAGAGKCSLVVEPSEPLTFESSIIRVRLNHSVADPLFHYYFFGSSTGRQLMSNIVAGTNVKGIRGSELRELQIPLPSLQEQRAIATALSDVDALLNSLDRLIAKKRDLKQAAMQQLLTGQTRLQGFHIQWQRGYLGELIIPQKKTKRPSSVGRDSGTYPFFTNITKPVDRFLDESDFNIEAIIANTGGEAYFNYHNGSFAAMADCFVFKTTLSTKYLYYFLKLNEQAININGFTGSGIKHLDKKFFAQFDVRYPSDFVEQNAIAEVLTEMDKELAALEKQRNKTAAHKQGMMQELLTGRTRLV